MVKSYMAVFIYFGEKGRDMIAGIIIGVLCVAACVGIMIWQLKKQGADMNKQFENWSRQDDELEKKHTCELPTKAGQDDNK